MPTYEYKCFACGHAFEKFQSIMAAPIKKCPECGKSKAKRLLGTGAGLIFKGSGFYTTDYRSEAYKSDQKSDAPVATTSESKSDTKSETKPEAKPGTADAAPAKPTPKAEPKQASKSAAKATKRSK